MYPYHLMTFSHLVHFYYWRTCSSSPCDIWHQMHASHFGYHQHAVWHHLSAHHPEMHIVSEFCLWPSQVCHFHHIHFCRLLLLGRQVSIFWDSSYPFQPHNAHHNICNVPRNWTLGIPNAVYALGGGTSSSSCCALLPDGAHFKCLDTRFRWYSTCTCSSASSCACKQLCKESPYRILASMIVRNLAPSGLLRESDWLAGNFPSTDSNIHSSAISAAASFFYVIFNSESASEMEIMNVQWTIR